VKPCTWCNRPTPDICMQCWQEHESQHNTCVDEAFDCGAAVAFGLLGMAEAIRGRQRDKALAWAREAEEVDSAVYAWADPCQHGQRYRVECLDCFDGGYDGGGLPLPIIPHDDLRALATAATPGPWRHASGTEAEPDIRTRVTSDACSIATTDWTRDAAYIAAASPNVVLGLLDEIERLRAIEEGRKP
jgi:hypothetical protein